MKLLICSDIHGDINGAEKIAEIFKKEKCDKIILLGDILYHGPRNDLPEGYDPKAVISLLNSMKGDIVAVRGNCDTEVDQMVLEFPILSDYSYVLTDGLTLFLTHGHNFNEDNLPPLLSSGDVIVHGHTHVLQATEIGKGIYYVNPGSVSIPKGGNPKTYAIYENRNFTIYDFDGGEVEHAVV